MDWKTKREDYSLQMVPESYRTWSWMSLVGVLFGITTAMVFLMTGGQWVEIYGTHNLIIAMVMATLVVGTVGFVLAIIASEVGLDMDLITSGSGMGYRGAGLTSLIYASAIVIYFAMEGSIIANAIHSLVPNIFISIIYIGVGAIFVPLTWYGLTIINWVMWITLPLCLLLLIKTILITASYPSVNFLSFQPTHPINLLTGPLLLLQLFALAPTFIANGTVAADFGRFIPRKKKTIGAIGISYLMNGCCFLGATLLGAWMSLKLKESNPGIYIPALLGGWGVFFVLITQLRINAINIYGGSLAFATFFSRTFNISPGRHWWIILTAVLAVALMFGHVLDHLTTVLTFEAIFLTAWVMAVLSYILFNRHLFKLSPKNFPYQKGLIPNYNPIGLSALIISCLIAVPMALGVLGPFYKSMAPLFAAGISFVIVPMVTFVFVKLLKNRKY